MKNYKRVLCILFAAVMMLQFTSCGKKNRSESDDSTEEKTEQTIKYKEKWVLSPSIQAQSVFSLPMVKFNENTNHYDVTYGENYVIEKDGKFGLIDSNGSLVISPEFDTITTCMCYDGYIVTVKEGEYYTSTYHIDSSNQKLWAYPHTCRGFSGNAFRWDSSTSSVSSLNINGDAVYSTGLVPFLPETMQIAEGSALTEKYALVNSGKKVNETDYSGAGVFTGGVAAVKNESGKWGYIDSNGKTVIPFEFDAVEGYNALHYETSTPFECSEGYLTVFKNGKYGIYTADGDMIVPCQYTCLSTVHDGRAYASMDGSSWGILCVDEKISNGIETDDTTSSSAEEYSAATSYTSAAY